MAQDERALILAPRGRDAAVAQAILREAGVEAETCADLDTLARELARGAALALVTDESLADADLRGLSAWLEGQPHWSDFPFVLLTRRSGGPDRNPTALRLMTLLGNISFLERPFNAMTLVSVVRSALRARRRQYEMRDHLQERERVAESLRETADRLAFAQTAGKLGSWEFDVATGEVIASEICKMNFGWDPGAELTYAYVLHAIHPEDRERVQAALGEALANVSDYDMEFRTVWPDGSVHWVQGRGRVVANPGGGLKMFGISLDITERKQAEARQWLLTAELDHRVKNMLAVIQALVAQTQRRATNLEDFGATLRGRFQALARTNSLLSQSRWEGASLRSVVLEELDPYRQEDGRVVAIEGPDLLLRPKAATALGMAIHELATNAAKHGAWSAPEGRVEVAWEFRGAPGGRTLSLTWRERGGPKTEPPRNRGFGSVLIERTLAYEMSGTVRLDFAPEGLSCEIDIPEDQLVGGDPDPGGGQRAPSQSGGEPDTANAQRKRILVVEDSALVAMEVEAALREIGWEVVGPASGLERALDLLDREAPDGAVLDIQLGDEEVYPLADMLRTRSVPFVFATGYDRAATLPERFQHTLTVQKPFDAATLKAAALKTFA